MDGVIDAFAACMVSQYLPIDRVELRSIFERELELYNGTHDEDEVMDAANRFQDFAINLARPPLIPATKWRAAFAPRAFESFNDALYESLQVLLADKLNQ